MLRLIYFFLLLLSVCRFAEAAPACRVYFDGNRQGTLTLNEEQVTKLINDSKSYQDKRNKEWFERRRCLCCHTTLPYMLSRGLDRNSKVNFEKFKEMAAEKVENPEDLPWYHADHAGRNSKPTEAVLNSLTLLMYDLAAQQGLSSTTLKSLKRIFETMDADGHIHWLDFHLEPFESKQGELWGNSMAVLAIEMAQKYSNYRPPINQYKKLKSFITADVSRLKPHEMSVLLWAHSFAAGEPMLTSKLVNSFVLKIKKLQNQNGSWNQKAIIGLGENKANTYATAISIIGLIKAGHGHLPAVYKAVKWLAGQQTSINSLEIEGASILWGASSMNRVNSVLNDGFATDIATSYSSLALQMYKNEVLNTL